MMRRKVLVQAGVAAVLLAAAPGAAKAAEGGSRMARYVDTFSSTAPGTGTARHASTDIVNPDDPNAKPPAVRRIYVELAPGTVMDTTAVAQCKASDAELVVRGVEACPADSRLGQGEIDVDTGFPDPNRILYNDFFFFNAPDELILLGRTRSTGTYVPVR